MQIDIWSDIACPFCFLGKHQLERALNDFDHQADVEVIYHSFELDKDAPLVVDYDVYDMLSNKYGMTREQAIASNENIAGTGKEIGIEFNQSKTQLTNTFDAHRLIHFAKSKDMQSQMVEALYTAYFTDGIHIGNHENLIKIARSIGLNEQEVSKVLSSDEFTAEVRQDEEAATKFGITGVPFFIIDAKYAISGAQGEENLLNALIQAHDLANESDN